MAVDLGELEEEQTRGSEDPLTGPRRGPQRGSKALKENPKKPTKNLPKAEQQAAVTGLGPLKLNPLTGVPLGAEVPRVFTPPLQELTPETTAGFACVAFLEETLGWKLLPYQRWLYLHALEYLPGTKNYRYNTLLLLVARQNGKTKWLLGLTLWRLYRDGAKLCLTSAQLLDYAEGTLREGVQEVTRSRVLNRDFVKYYETNGKHKLRLSNDREWRAVAANRKGGRSLSADVAVLDELREHTNYDSWNALTPTTTAVHNSLVVAVSNAGDQSSVVLNNLQDQALARLGRHDTADTSTFYAEYSLPEDADYEDRDLWHLANPALGWLFDLRKLEGFYESKPPEGFKTEHLCMRVPSLQAGVFDYEKWRKLRNPEARPQDGAEVHYAVDVSWDRKRAHVVVVVPTDDGRLLTEVVASRAGTKWVKNWFKERLEDPDNPFTGRFAVQSKGAPSATLYDELSALRVDPDDEDSDPLFDVVRWEGPELAKSAGVLADYLDEEALVHRDQPVLNEAFRCVQSKVSGDAWYLDRRKSNGDASPALAACAALWLLTQPKEEQRASAYEDYTFELV
ncbi:terminase [Gordonia phage Ghobes]|uniref:Terminase n=1 Tax=Gordonia phage Ghobes TaxID=1887647 RepID=A0A1B3B018_9CAUD|nr:terminase [Gordonia phage Ghobes]AOE44355.1 terminase [Gordonia phage Ghobes]